LLNYACDFAPRPRGVAKGLSGCRYLCFAKRLEHHPGELLYLGQIEQVEMVAERLEKNRPRARDMPGFSGVSLRHEQKQRPRCDRLGIGDLALDDHLLQLAAGEPGAVHVLLLVFPFVLALGDPRR
jgi:hypothetical protein